MIQLVQLGMISEETLKVYLEQLFKAFEFGATQEIMEAFEQFKGEGNMSKQQLEAMKVAIAEVFESMQKEGIIPDEEKRVMEAKVGAGEAIEELGGGGGQASQQEEKPPSRSIPFKDLPPSGKAQLAAQAGIDISPEEVVEDEVEQEQIKGINKSGGA